MEKTFLSLFVTVGLISGPCAFSQVYDSQQQGALESKSPKEQLLLVEKIGTCGNDDSRRAFWFKKAYIDCFDLLHNFNKSLRRDEVDKCNFEDVRKKYYEALRACGLNFSEAKEKAGALQTE